MSSTTIPTENDKNFIAPAVSAEAIPVTTGVETPEVSPSQIDVVMHPRSGDKHANFYRREGDMVWRLFYDDSTFDRDGRYRCVAYCRNEANGLTEYGAAVFKKDDGCTFNKRRVRHELSHTARNRFRKRPIRLVMNDVSDRTDLQKRLTKAMFRYGVGSKHVLDDADKVLVHGSM